MRWRRSYVVGLMVALLLSTSSVVAGEEQVTTGGDFVEIARLSNLDLEPEAWFGNMAVSGNTVVVGAHGDDHSGITDAGSAHVFEGSGSSWVLQQSLTAPDAAPFDKFGEMVTISGDTIAVGSIWHDNPAFSCGAVYVFTRTGSTWVFQQKLAFSDHQEADRCGVGLDISGDTIAVGCTDGCGGGGGSPGKVHIFTRTGNVWTEQKVFTAHDVGYNDYFGTPVAIDGDTLVVGSRGNDHSGLENAGAAYVYTRSGRSWEFEQKIIAGDAGIDDSFGTPLDFDGDTIVVSSPFDDHSACNGAGSAYIYSRVGDTWVEQQKLIAETPIDEDDFGWSSSVWGDTALIGTSGSFRNPNTWETTASDFFIRTDQSFERRHRIIGGDLGCLIGWNVAVEGDLALVSGCDPDLGVAAVYVFKMVALFFDSFESGDTSAWSATVP